MSKPTKKTSIRRREAAKYNGFQLDGIKAKKYALYIDYLVLNCSGFPNLKNTKLTVDEAPYGTRQFHKRVELSNEHHQIGTLLYDRRNDNVQITDWCQIKLDNHLFYTTPLSEIKTYLQSLLSDLQVDVHSINRLDIALDYPNASNKTQKLLQGLASERFIMGGRPKDVTIHSKTNKNGVEYQGVSIGRRGALRFGRLYDKTRELNEKGHKEYITKSHENIGLKGNIWRLEYELKNGFLTQIEHFTLYDIFDKTKLYNIFLSACDNHFKIHKKKKRAEINKMPIFNFLNFDKVAKGIQTVVQKVTKLKRVIKETIIGEMRLIKALLRNYFSSNQRLEYMLALNATLETFELNSWYENKLPEYLQEFKKKQIFKTFNSEQFIEDSQICI